MEKASLSLVVQKMDFSQTLITKSDAILDQWVEAVYQDQQIEATNELTFKAVRDSLPRVLKAFAF
ncbi:RsbRD N-terminal domain-containing protein [Nostoc sp.]|uniref:RsbRD N-terminal domain-containing protein n=1 Tax=Nostoc sp. TaxID=1180 RepID=UPI003FA5A421